MYCVAAFMLFGQQQHIHAIIFRCRTGFRIHCS
jgi:hypothetical protein